MAGTFDHYLAALFLRPGGKLTERSQLGDLRLIGGIGYRSRSKPIPERKTYIILG
jgi:hypothetical protein